MGWSSDMPTEFVLEDFDVAGVLTGGAQFLINGAPSESGSPATIPSSAAVFRQASPSLVFRYPLRVESVCGALAKPSGLGKIDGVELNSAFHEVGHKGDIPGESVPNQDFASGLGLPHSTRSRKV